MKRIKRAKRILSFIMSLVMLVSMCIVTETSGVSAAEENVLAFPGAEGGGKYTKGARNAESPTVYHVTNLNASGTGSLADAVSQSGRIIVFDVGGTINISSTLEILSNTTILGQTAPGDGITIAGSDVLLTGDNIIIRYLRVRPSDVNGGEPDGLGGRWVDNVILDHCSVSWSIDEGLTLYGGSLENSGEESKNITMQYCIGAESLRMSNHIKGAHGYGAIWGGNIASYHHNLLAHHDSRSPRLDRNIIAAEVVNNVIYDWGLTNSAYGAEGHSYNNDPKINQPSNVNWENNYYKYGPGTKSSIRNRIFEVSKTLNADGTIATASDTDRISNFYFSGNYVFGDAAVTSNNLDGIKSSTYGNMLAEPISMEGSDGIDYSVTPETSENAYENVLNNAGATLPKRDSIDARIVDDVRNGTGRILNKPIEVGGFIKTETVERTFEIPQEWKDANGMGSAKETDIVSSGEWKGYTWIEAYVNDWTAEQSAPTNPHITVESPNISTTSNIAENWTVIKDTKPLTYSAKITPESGTDITKVEIVDNENVIKTYSASELTKNEDGTYQLNANDIALDSGTHFILSRAYNDKGESTASPTSIVYVTSDSVLSDVYKHAQIGTVSYDSKGASFAHSDGVFTVGGSGSISNSNGDNCDFMYRTVSGDFEYVARIVDIPKFENGVMAGMMVRESLDTGSRMAMISDSWLKYGENIRIAARTETNAASAINYMKNSAGNAISNDSSGYSTETYPMPKYMKIARTGDTLTFSVSDSGTDFTDNCRQPYSVDISGLADTLYIGFAVDSARGTANRDYYTMAQFDKVTLNGVAEVEVEPEPTGDNEIVVYSLNTEYTDGNDYLVLTGGTDGTSYANTVNGLSGYGAWTGVNKSASYTYTDADGYSYDYNFTKAWQAGAGSKTKRSLFFTPKSECKVTAVFLGSESTRSMTIYQSDENRITQPGTNAVVSVSLEVTDTTKPVYVYGGSRDKQLFAIIVEYYKEADEYVPLTDLNTDTSATNKVTLTQESSDTTIEYKTLREAFEKAKELNPKSNDERIVLSLTPGVYREQNVLEVPYVTIKKDESYSYVEPTWGETETNTTGTYLPDANKEAIITWYYGIGSSYNSIGSNGFYDPSASNSEPVACSQKWGTALYVTSAAKEFIAEDIVFENSYNRYVTDAEIADGVTPNDGKPARTKTSDVASDAYNERAAAVYTDSDKAQYINCKMLSSQDTFGLNSRAYLKNCYIEGRTDYICGVATAVFDNCKLMFYGWSDNDKSGTITAMQGPAAGNDYGVLFNECYIGNTKSTTIGGCLGRPWRQPAQVTYLNCIYENNTSLISASGWSGMDCEPEEANFREYGTKYADGTAVDLSNRTVGTVLNDWTVLEYNGRNYLKGLDNWDPMGVAANYTNVDTVMNETTVVIPEGTSTTVDLPTAPSGYEFRWESNSEYAIVNADNTLTVVRPANGETPIETTIILYVRETANTAIGDKNIIPVTINPTTDTENVFTLSGTVSLTSAADKDVNVTIKAYRGSAVIKTQNITIPAGNTSTQYSATGIPIGTYDVVYDCTTEGYKVSVPDGKIAVTGAKGETKTINSTVAKLVNVNVNVTGNPTAIGSGVTVTNSDGTYNVSSTSGVTGGAYWNLSALDDAIKTTDAVTVKYRLTIGGVFTNKDSTNGASIDLITGTPDVFSGSENKARVIRTLFGRWDQVNMLDAQQPAISGASNTEHMWLNCSGDKFDSSATFPISYDLSITVDFKTSSITATAQTVGEGKEVKKYIFEGFPETIDRDNLCLAVYTGSAAASEYDVSNISVDYTRIASDEPESSESPEVSESPSTAPSESASPSEAPSAVDKAALKNAIEAAIAAYNTSVDTLYTESSLVALKAAIETAKSVYLDEESTADSVTAAAEALANSADGLVKLYTVTAAAAENGTVTITYPAAYAASTEESAASEEPAGEAGIWDPTSEDVKAKIVGVANPEPITIGSLTVDPLQDLKDDTTRLWKTSTDTVNGVTANNNPKPASGSGSPSKDNAPVYGTVLKITVTAAGTVNSKVTLGAGKTITILKFTKDATTGGTEVLNYANPATTAGGTKVAYEYSIDAESGYDYYVYVAGSKGVFGAVTYTPKRTASPPDDGFTVLKEPKAPTEGIVYAKADDTVKFTVAPNVGFKVNTVSVTNAVPTPSEGIYSFTMPNSDTVITVTFSDASPSESTAPSETPSESTAPSETPSESATPSESPSESAAPSVTPSESTSPSETPSESTSPSVTPSESATPSETPSESATPSETPSESATPSETPSESATPSETPSESTPPTVDKTQLNKAIEAAMTYNADEYTEVSFAALSAAITTAKEVAEKADATQEAVDNAKTGIETAIANLVKKSENPNPSTSPSVTPSESTSPSETPSESTAPSVTPSESATPSETPSESAAPSETPSESAAPSETPAESTSPSETPSESTSPSESPSESTSPSETPSESVAPSETPSESTPPTVDKTQLNKAIETAMTYNADEYTEVSFAALSAAITTAKEVAEKADATQEAVDNAKTGIETAIANLVKKSENPNASTAPSETPTTEPSDDPSEQPTPSVIPTDYPYSITNVALSDNGVLSADIKYSGEAENVTAKLIIAKYNSSGALMGLNAEDLNGDISITKENYNLSDNGIIRLYIWDSFESAKPLSQSVQIEK